MVQLLVLGVVDTNISLFQVILTGIHIYTLHKQSLDYRKVDYRKVR